jgi:hypothetical protein
VPDVPDIADIAAFERRLDDLRAQVSHRIPMRELFALAKAFPAASVADMERLLDGPTHEHKVAAVSLMDFRARRKKIDDDQRRELYELYRRRHDRIDTWDLVDRAAPHAVGGFLHPRSRAPLDELAASEHWYERRTAIVATWYFIRLGETADTFRIGATLAHDPVELVQKAVGGWVRPTWDCARGEARAEHGRNPDASPRRCTHHA